MIQNTTEEKQGNVIEIIASKCGKYRYKYSQIWDNAKQPCIFICLNPLKLHTSNSVKMLDNCKEIAEIEKCGGIIILNLFPHIALSERTQFINLYKNSALTSVREQNDKVIEETLTFFIGKNALIMFAWCTCKRKDFSEEKEISDRVKYIKKIVQDIIIKNKNNIFVKYIKRTNQADDGQPNHPYYYSQQLSKIEEYTFI